MGDAERHFHGMGNAVASPPLQRHLPGAEDRTAFALAAPLEHPAPARHFVCIEPMRTTSSLDTWGMARRSRAQGPRR